VTKVTKVTKGTRARTRRRTLLAFTRVRAFLTYVTSVTCVTCVTFATALAAENKPFAAPQVADAAPTSTAGGLAQVTFSLLLVLAAVFAAAWLVRRLRGFGRFGAGAVEVVADVALGTKERAVLVQVGKQQLLLGVAPGRVTTLHVLPEPVEVTRPAPPSGTPGANVDPAKPDFKAILKRSLGL
jgi:flagellar protein FliO/FliZ